LVFWQGKASSFFFLFWFLFPKSSCQKSIYKFGLPIDSWPGCAYTAHLHTLTHERTLPHPHPHTFSKSPTRTYSLAVITFSMTFYWPSGWRAGRAQALRLKL